MDGYKDVKYLEMVGLEGQCPGDCLHSMAGHGQDGVAGRGMFVVPD